MSHLTMNRVASLAVLATALSFAACSKKVEPPPPAAETAPVAEAAPAPAPKEENAHAFKIGDLSAVALRDGGLEPPNDNKVFGAGRTPEEVAAVLGAAGLPTDKLSVSIQPLLVKSGDRVLLFDTGAGTNFGPGAGKLLASFTEAGIDPASVTDIFISHSHGDHVGGLVSAEGALNFPNATIHLSKPEWKYMSGIKDYAAMNKVIAAKVDAFTPDAQIVPGVVKAVAIKGHTPGHSGYLITSGAESLLYVGDSMHHFVVSVQKPEWLNAFDADGAVAAASRAELIAKSAETGQRIYAVHFPFPGIGKFEKRGETIVWVAQ